ncbi:hypothetical protein PsorP6_017832 [Peronosclerospora sorghi]|uniref:Uncharacterized protein n=1 Tax=Peronosclerospora sorghi TaxID=230839 RepID=A0ACC0WE91_9STRA|nr:hypothetical protein PsorP6_017832 [Peronosclerospora sorghi]
MDRRSHPLEEFSLNAVPGARRGDRNVKSKVLAETMKLVEAHGVKYRSESEKIALAVGNFNFYNLEEIRGDILSPCIASYVSYSFYYECIDFFDRSDVQYQEMDTDCVHRLQPQASI